MLHFRGERGQTMVEFALFATALMMLTVGLVDSGRAFFQYNAVSAAARYGARWGSVVGGTCSHRTLSVGSATSDWCNSLGTGGGPFNDPFWSQPGNEPAWTGASGSCPSSYSGADSTNSYTASNYTGASSTTIVGAIVQRFDSNSSSTNFITGNLTPGIDLSKTKICIQLPPRAWNSDSNQWLALPGDTITVYIYYPFYPVSSLLPATQLNLVASAQYLIEAS
jgi:hypothetical protein